MEPLTILQGHVLDELGKLVDGSVHCIVTSPPYWGLRDYKLEAQVWPLTDSDTCGALQHDWTERCAGADEQALAGGKLMDRQQCALNVAEGRAGDAPPSLPAPLPHPTVFRRLWSETVGAG